jgi:hypothetical protein
MSGGRLTDRQLEQYMQEVRDLCFLARYALRRLHERLDEGARNRAWYIAEVRRQEENPDLEYGPYSGIDPYATFYADAVVSLGARVARLLRPSEIRGGRVAQEWAEARGAALRAALGVGAERLIAPAMRNSIEHFDERLDEAIRSMPEAIVYRRNLTDHAWPEQQLSHYRARVLNIKTLAYTIGLEMLELGDLGARLETVEQATNDWFTQRSGGPG